MGDGKNISSEYAWKQKFIAFNRLLSPKKAIANSKTFWYWRLPLKEFRHSFEHMLPNLCINHTSKTNIFITAVKT